MTRYKTLEFWLVLLPLLFILGGVLAGFDNERVLKYLLPVLAAVWLILAVFWMGRELYRRIQG